MHKITKKGVFPLTFPTSNLIRGSINFLDSNKEEIEEGIYASDLNLEEVTKINESTIPKTRINFNAIKSLTDKESSQLNAFIEGMDEEKEGWLHEMAIFEGKTLSGVVSSLVKKGLITSQEDGGDFWIIAK